MPSGSRACGSGNVFQLVAPPATPEPDAPPSEAADEVAAAFDLALGRLVPAFLSAEAMGKQ